MLLSLDKKFLFVHVPKAAGTSVNKALEPWVVHPPLDRWNKLRSRFGWQKDPAKVHLRVHASLADAYRLLPGELADGLFKFAFVRNPFDRLVSEYSYIVARDNHPRHREVTALPDFLSYLKYEKERARGRSQVGMLAPPAGRPGMDFVGRFESLSADFAEACRRIGIEAEIPHLNKTKHRDFRDFYDHASRAYVEQAYGDELEAYGYSF